MEEEGFSEYEKRRIARISENRARMEALGLLFSPPPFSVLLRNSSRRRRARENAVASPATMETRSTSPSMMMVAKRMRIKKGRAALKWRRMTLGPIPVHGEGQVSLEPGTWGADRRMPFHLSSANGKKWSSLITAKFKKTLNARKSLNESDIFDDEAALKKAIALSLGANTGSSAKVSMEVSQSYANVAGAYAQGKKDEAKTQESAGRKKARKLNKARVQLAEDEVVAFFFSFDETGKGYITPRDVKKMFTCHDFTWTDTEIAHMIHSFGSDGDGKVKGMHTVGQGSYES